MELSEFVVVLEKRLRQPLPGRFAQLKMSSLVRIQELMKFSAPEDAIQSSVLILLYPIDGGIGLVLMLRPEYGGIHGGQISLPGGKYEETDESLIYTALREAQEEIGIDPAKVQILGQLTEMYIPPSNFMVTPVVAYQASQPRFVADPKEVAKIIEIRLDDLLDRNNMQKKKIKLSMGISLKVPSFYINGYIIWGATAMILSELKEIANEIWNS
ncbi:MAG: CoA pyrophosphatase [Bacteroidales bacterium]|nr:CoA pyrophosphatase [Bacteroidales bacterium]